MSSVITPIMREISFQYSPNYSFIFPFELNFDKDYHQKWMSRNWNWCVYISVIYVFLAFTGQAWMRSRPAFNIRNFLIIWNIFLSIFSTVGALRTLPELFHVTSKYGIHFSICNRSYIEFDKIAGFWAWIFTLSKSLELVDTLFIVLRRQKLIFLHWSHHVSALVTSWSIYSDHPAMGRWMMCTNFTVHGVMYGYYALRAAKVKVPRVIAMSITTAQIVQMILCFMASLYTFLMKLTGNECDISWKSSVTVFLVYGTFFWLFVRFFLGNYGPTLRGVKPTGKLD